MAATGAADLGAPVRRPRQAQGRDAVAPPSMAWAAPVMKELLGQPGLPSTVAGHAEHLRATVRDRIAHVVRSRMPRLDDPTVDRHSATLPVLVGAFMPMAVAAGPGDAGRDGIVRELETVLRGYLREIDGPAGPVAGEV